MTCKRMRWHALGSALAVLAGLACRGPAVAEYSRRDVMPNDNRVPAIARRGDTAVFTLDARIGAWRPDTRVDSAMTVLAFAAADGVPRIPGPLLRVTQGTVVEIHVQNHVGDSLLVVHGLRPGLSANDTVQVVPGATRTVYFTASSPGTFLYWSRASGDRMARSELRDGLLSGAIVVDPIGSVRDTTERVMVINVLDILPDSTKPPARRDDLFYLTINGRTWPFTEPLQYSVGDTVRWRLVNASNIGHPMHLHGFHFARTARGDGVSDTLYDVNDRELAVTELMRPGSTFAMEWIPTRAGRWLFHCHFVAHIVPFPPRPDSARHLTHADFADSTTVARAAAEHARDAMWGLVMAITTVARDTSGGGTAPVQGLPARRMRLFVQQSSARWPGDSVHIRGYVLQAGMAPPAADSVVVPGPALVLTRGERTAITVVNRLPQATSVHWHGMELESYYDGVAGWSGADSRRAPMVAPGDSFVALMTPPRAGTFMYHPHMDEEDQLAAGLFGPLIVLEPGERFDPDTDRLLVLGSSIVDGKRRQTVNGQLEMRPMSVRVERTYRLRILNIAKENTASIRLFIDTTTQTWRPLAKDGATLPTAAQRMRPALLRNIASGETYDFQWRPTLRGVATLEVSFIDEPAPYRIPVHIR